MPTEFTVRTLSTLAGVSPRTLRHYDALGLLRPSSTRPSGYRVYGPTELDRLQRILFFRELGMPLDAIRKALDAPGYDDLAALRAHREALVERWRRVESLVDLLDRTIAEKEGRIRMKDKEKFEAFKKGLVESNETRYGAEVRAKYGDEAVDASNRRVLDMDEAKMKEAQDLATAIIDRFVAAYATGDPTGPLAREGAELHARWLRLYWKKYTKTAHAGIVRMYVEDPRFTAYYDQHQPGLAVFLRDAVLAWLGDMA
jgi:DNA-binding transcriptional MerR regulator